ncbi:MAG: PorV/PorQ family protein [Candidatus Marinimicrobia bacterium]|jgi:hypothetical protein|nr:PorV/PorQ family protein [Candidatus Neomarinimicrobiota bacterium]MBT3936967.1 PorV/PorQ family protein [Candidatus Neomarinimicrobiota bacterium]MBT3962241.1 PorV/PorQ family protein [Candidatus Neomarinimicrobiota bacterium]MBT4635668.1 PorV/PorQ family protein [Candidatus Neomarinimicrobiota bacterium]MBT6943523.1 PorV/PorQ family protein [Candidatus Neomarinimicrobiota bacterium]
MKFNKQIIILILFSSMVFGSENKKLAQTGFQFLSISADARGGGMGDAMTTLFGNSSSLFFNPAGLSRQEQMIDFSFSSNDWIAGISHEAFSISLSPKNGQYGVFGFSMLNVDYGELQGTMVWDNEQGFIDTEIFKPTALSLGFGYGRSLSENFSVGGHIKKAYQNLGYNVVPTTDTSKSVQKNTADAMAFDFGTIYQTDWHNFAFGMSVRNFSDETQFSYDGFQLPLTFRIGASLELIGFTPLAGKSQSLLLAVDALHPRSYPERMNIGLEYSFKGMANLRMGYLYNYDQRGLTYGAGVKVGPITIDYALTPFGIFDDVSRLSIGIAR